MHTVHLYIELLETKVFLISNCALWHKIVRCVPNEPKIAVHILQPFKIRFLPIIFLAKTLAQLFGGGARELMYLNLIRFCVLPFNKPEHVWPKELSALQIVLVFHFSLMEIFLFCLFGLVGKIITFYHSHSCQSSHSRFPLDLLLFSQLLAHPAHMLKSVWVIWLVRLDFR